MNNYGGRGGRETSRPGRGYHNRRKQYISAIEELKYNTFEEGTAVKAAQYTDTMKKVVQYILTSGVKEATLIATSIENKARPTIAPPPRPTPAEDPVNPGKFLPEDPAEIAIWEEEIKMTARRRKDLVDGLQWAYAVLKGQCDPSTWGKIEGEEGFKQIRVAMDPILLKERIKRVCCWFQAHQQAVYSMVHACKSRTNQMKTGRRN
jgi:hypothetical protein